MPALPGGSPADTAADSALSARRPQSRLRDTPDRRSGHGELAELRTQFPAFRVIQESRPDGRTCYVATRSRTGVHPHTMITSDPDELRAELSDAIADGT
jgi:Txe/YoeB family toxin of toxin-antitoxin system